MSKLKEIKCCDECWHDSSNECFDFIDCINNEPHCHHNEECKHILSQKLSKLRYEETDIPVIFVGAGTCGLGAGAKKTIAEINNYLSANNIIAEVVEVGCIGLCAEEPIVDIQLPKRTRVSFKKVTSDKVEPLLSSILDSKIPLEHVFGQHKNELLTSWDNIPFLSEHSFFKSQTRWVLQNCGIINPENIDTYISYGGYKALSKALKNLTPYELADKIIASGLRGRGGGGFLSGMKWKMAQEQKESQKYLICNADEGDPGAFMDRAVIEGDPYRLIEGMTIASYAIGASKAYIYIRAEYPLAISRLKIAIEQAKDYGLLGKNILDSGFSLEIVIKKGAGAFVCGEETALMQSIEGKRGMPKPRPPFPTTSGLFGKPTVINNVETLANVPDIISKGEEWFSSVGTAKSKGTKVFALSGNIKNTGLVEVAMGTPLHEIVYDIGGGIPNGKKFKAVQIGGPSGGCIPASHLHIDIDYESLKTVGAMMGSGGLVVMDEDTCMVDVARFFMDFIQRESCGKCIPCREGTRRMLEILDRISTGKRSTKERATLERFQSIMQLKGLASVIQDTSLCGLGKSAPNPVLSTLRWFKEEYEIHIYEKKCPAKVCKDLLTYNIIEDKCTGCTICAKKCPTNAIVGSLKHPHYVVMEKCIGCGNCVEVCNFDAVVFE
jgi:NADH:ubiquinone oxidoreductase subunit F (NADH-binding)/Pyruvate/2-oxoacid:ferredoxin oxidoreductase delta subunit